MKYQKFEKSKIWKSKIRKIENLKNRKLEKYILNLVNQKYENSKKYKFRIQNWKT